MDSSPSSSVFTPADGDNWSIAKTRVQLATFVTSQLSEHLLKTQFLMEPVCLVANRHLPLKHPLRQVLRRHCVGTLTLNKFIELGDINPFGQFDSILTPGFAGNIDLINQQHNEFSFNDLNSFERLRVSNGI